MTPCEGIKYLCRQCSKQFSKKGPLNGHERAVHEGVKYPCGQCNYQATTKGSLAKHKRAVHEGVKYSCGQCGKQFSSKGNLAEHKRAVHEGVKYPCGQCNYQATTKSCWTQKGSTWRSQISLCAMQLSSNIRDKKVFFFIYKWRFFNKERY